MLIIRLEVGPLASNAYLVRDNGGEEGAVIDPGAEGDRIVQRCRTEGIVPRLLINTHGHVDHIGANASLKAAFPDALLCVGARDADRLTDPVANRFQAREYAPDWWTFFQSIALMKSRLPALALTLTKRRFPAR